MKHPLIESGRLRDLNWIHDFIERASSPYELDALFHLVSLNTAYPAYHPDLAPIVLHLAEKYKTFEDKRLTWDEFPEREKDRTLLWFLFAVIQMSSTEFELDRVKDLVRRTIPSDHPEMTNIIKEIRETRGGLRD